MYLSLPTTVLGTEIFESTDDFETHAANNQLPALSEKSADQMLPIAQTHLQVVKSSLSAQHGQYLNDQLPPNFALCLSTSTQLEGSFNTM